MLMLTCASKLALLLKLMQEVEWLPYARGKSLDHNVGKHCKCKWNLEEYCMGHSYTDDEMCAPELTRRQFLAGI